MRNYLLLLLKMFCFWWFIFIVNRFVFILFFFQKFAGVAWQDVPATFLHGMLLDWSAVCYVLVIPLLIFPVQQFVAINFYRAFLLFYVTAVLLLVSFVSVFDLAIYDDWGTKLSYRAIHFLKYANEGASFIAFSETLELLVVMLLQVIIGIFVFQKLFRYKTYRFHWDKKWIIPALLLQVLILGILPLGMRGGWQQIPINESSAYFSKYEVVNDAAVNTFWNAVKKLISDRRSLYRNPYRFMPDNTANHLVQQLYAVPRDSIVPVLKTDRPNVVLFILESFTADVVESLGGEKGVTPNLDTIIQHGLLFDNIYAQGFRTDQGLAAVISGFPAQPNFSIIMQPEKYKHLHFLPEKMAANGYQTAFFYGGEAAFANMKAYLLQSGITQITDKNDFPSDEMNAKWGAHDGFVFQKAAVALNHEKAPFFAIVLSLSSHEPFEVPMESRFPGNDFPSLFKNACAYTDLSLGAFFESAKNEPWYANTLFIFVADHGHILPRNRNPREPARFHIPIIFYGEVLDSAFRGAKISNLGMQADLPATLLGQLHIPADDFNWSNNLLNPFRNNFAYYTSDDAFGWITDHGPTVYDLKNNASVQDSGRLAGEKDGKAFLQTLFQDYINY